MTATVDRFDYVFRRRACGCIVCISSADNAAGLRDIAHTARHYLGLGYVLTYEHVSKVDFASHMAGCPHGGEVPAASGRAFDDGDEPMSYIGVKACGCIEAAMVDGHRTRDDLAGEVASWIRDGLHIERVTCAAVRAGDWDCKHEARQEALL